MEVIFCLRKNILVMNLICIVRLISVMKGEIFVFIVGREYFRLMFLGYKWVL